MKINRCLANCSCSNGRREFIKKSALVTAGAVYDGEATKNMYTAELKKATETIGVSLELRDAPVYYVEEADAWLKTAKESKTDSLFVILLDRQEHAWPTAMKSAESGILKLARKLGAGINIIQTEDLKNGSYIVRILTKDKSYNKLLIK